MIRTALRLDTLAVETFATTPAVPGTPGHETVEGCDGAYLMAPMTYHTDPCDRHCERM